MMEVCGDGRFEIIEKAKQAIIESTNIETSPEEMAVLDNILFRCWQMGWLDKYDTQPSATGDLISRQAVLDAINGTFWTGIEKAIKSLPSAPDSRQRGEWVFEPKDAIKLMFTKPKCSECGFESADGGNFCSNCGAKMYKGGEDE